MSRNIGHLTRKSRDKDTDYNESVYDRELNKLLSHLQGSGDLEYSTQDSPGPTSLLNLRLSCLKLTCRLPMARKRGGSQMNGHMMKNRVNIATTSYKPG